MFVYISVISKEHVLVSVLCADLIHRRRGVVYFYVVCVWQLHFFG
jgi:hypothetical protein